MGKIIKSYFSSLYDKSNPLFLIILILTLLILIYPEIRILAFNYSEGYSTLLAQPGNDAIREDIYLYYPSYKNFVLGKSFFFNNGSLDFKDYPLPLPYINQIIGNILTQISFGDDNISIILLRAIPVISLILLYKIFLNIEFSKNESIIFSFFVIISVYETSRFPSPSITYIFFLVSIFLIIKSLNSSRIQNYNVSIICGLQIWIYFHNFVIVAPIFIYSLILRKFFFKNDYKKILKELLIFFVLFISYFIFTLAIKENIQASFFEKILWSSDYKEWRDYNIQTTFDGRYKIAIILILTLSILSFIFNFKKILNVNNFIILFKNKNFLDYHIFFIIFILTTFFPIILEKFINFPQPQVIFIRIGQFQVFFLLCIFYKLFFSFLSKRYLNIKYRIKINNFFLVLFLLIGIFFSYKNISFLNNDLNYNIPDFTINSDEKKLISFLNNQEKCVLGSTNKKITHLAKIKSDCRIINSNIFNSNLEFDVLIERYILVDFLAGYKLDKILRRFNLDKKFILSENKICHYHLKTNYNEIIQRDDHISQIFHHGKCDPLLLKKYIIDKYQLIFEQPKYYIKKYKFKYLYTDYNDQNINSKLIQETKIKNLFKIKN